MKTMNLNEYNGVCIFAEQHEGRLSQVGLELLGKGRELADARKTFLAAVLVGNGVANLAGELARYGADKVYLADDPALERYRSDTYAAAVCQYIEGYKPEIFLVGATCVGRDLAPKVARRVGTGLTADCTGLDIDENGFLLQTRPAFGGNLIATIATPDHRPQMSSVRPRVMSAMAPQEGRSAEVTRLPYTANPADLRVEIAKILEKVQEGVKIEEANVLVAAGRGVTDAEGLELVRILAKTLGGEVAASRDIVDAGLLSHDHQVGQTGKTVKPQLYIACGISGAVQHTAGMKNSDIIVAINTDPKAPIFDVSDYGIVGDLYQILPAITEAVQNTAGACR